MKKITDITDLFEHDQLIHDFEFVKRLCDSEITVLERYSDDDGFDDLIWGDLIG